MNQTPGTIDLEIDGSVARILLNHPPLNILTTDMRLELLDRIGIIENNRAIRVVIFQAAQGTFSVGSDLKEFPQDEVGGRQKIQFEQFLLNRVERMNAITIALLSGYVLGGGAELMLATDLRIGADDVQIGFPEVKVGGFPAAGGVWRLVRDLGPVRAKELLLFGKSISAEAARNFGLINECVPRDQVQQRLRQIVEELLALPQSSLLAIKRTVALAALNALGDPDSQITDEYGRLFLQPDIFEGIRAFIEKRPPKFNRALESGALPNSTTTPRRKTRSNS